MRRHTFATAFVMAAVGVTMAVGGTMVLGCSRRDAPASGAVAMTAAAPSEASQDDEKSAEFEEEPAGGDHRSSARPAGGKEKRRKAERASPTVVVVDGSTSTATSQLEPKDVTRALAQTVTKEARSADAEGGQRGGPLGQSDSGAGNVRGGESARQDAQYYRRAQALAKQGGATTTTESDADKRPIVLADKLVISGALQGLAEDQSGRALKVDAEKPEVARDEPVDAMNAVTGEELQKPRDGKLGGDVDDDGLIDPAKPEPPADPEPSVKAPEPVPPPTFLPSMFYFENTYLGGDAAYREKLRLLDEALGDAGAAHRLAVLPPQSFDAPEHDGLGLTATLDRSTVEGAGRVFLQVGLRGSERYGWRRPPLELVAVVDSGELGAAPGAEFVEALIRKLDVQDRLAVVASGRDVAVAELDGIRRHRAELMPRLDRALGAPRGDLEAALRLAGRLLVDASAHRTTAPGTQVILLLTSSPARAAANARLVSELGLEGIVTSVICLGDEDGASGAFTVAAAGQGNLHAAQDMPAIGAAVDAELELLAKVVARLVRVNVRLAPGVKVARVLGSRPLGLEEVAEVKAHEVETDKRLSNVLGIAHDRGDDDDGIQTVIPVFYGGDSHVVVLELWVERPGPVADVSVKYKDLVNLDNATARTSVALETSDRGATQDQSAIGVNVRSLEGSEALVRAADAIDDGDPQGARMALTRAPAAAIATFQTLLERMGRGELDADMVSGSLRLAAQRAAGGGS